MIVHNNMYVYLCPMDQEHMISSIIILYRLSMVFESGDYRERRLLISVDAREAIHRKMVMLDTTEL